jgi:hypothetical protein
MMALVGRFRSARFREARVMRRIIKKIKNEINSKNGEKKERKNKMKRICKKRTKNGAETKKTPQIKKEVLQNRKDAFPRGRLLLDSSFVLKNETIEMMMIMQDHDHGAVLTLTNRDREDKRGYFLASLRIPEGYAEVGEESTCLLVA